MAETQHTAGAAPDATITVVVADIEPAEAPQGPDRGQAADFIHRFLGQQKLQAEGTVRELVDDEVQLVLDAGGNRHTARDQIKAVLSRAYDRRREAAALEARKREAAAAGPAADERTKDEG